MEGVIIGIVSLTALGSIIFSQYLTIKDLRKHNEQYCRILNQINKNIGLPESY